MRMDSEALRARLQGQVFLQLAERMERAARRAATTVRGQGAGAARSWAVATGGDPARFDALILEAAERHGVHPALVKAVIRAESGYDPRAVSTAGAKGLMQLMDTTAEGLGVTDSFDPAQNIDGGARYLRMMLDRFGDVSLALAAYNAGPGAVERFGGVPPYAETQKYVPCVLDGYRYYLDTLA